MTTFTDISLVLPLEFTDETLVLGDRVEFITKMNSRSTKMATWSADLSTSIATMNTLGNELEVALAGITPGDAVPQLRLEDGDGTEYTELKAGTSQASNLVLVLPLAAGTAGQVLSIDSVASDTMTLSWATAAAGGGGGMPLWSDLDAGEISALVAGDLVRDSTGSVRVLNNATRKGSAVVASVDPDTEVGHPKQNWENLTHPIVATFADLSLLDETLAAVSNGVKVIDSAQTAHWNLTAWQYPDVSVARIAGGGTILVNRHQTLDTTGATTTTTVGSTDYTTHDFTLPDPVANEDLFFSAAVIGDYTARLVGNIDGDTSALILTNYKTFNAVSDGTEWISS